MTQTWQMNLAVAQMTSTTDIEQNLATVESLINEAARRGADMLSLPECFASLGDGSTRPSAIAQPLDGPIIQRMQAAAQKASLWLSLGGFQETNPENPDRCFNAHLILDANGEIKAVYRKIHLFDIDIPGGPRLMESDDYAPGKEIVTCQTPWAKLGLGICYDLRFAEMHRSLAQLGAEVLLLPAAFTMATGKEHWQTLHRARAIENQLFVAAAAQRGQHNSKRSSFGHALIVDPWGTVLAEAPDRTGIAITEISSEDIRRVRQGMPMESHRRPELFS